MPGARLLGDQKTGKLRSELHNMQEDKIGNSRMVQNGKKTRLARKYHTAVCPEGPADDGKRSGLSKSALGVACGGPKASIPIRFIFFITEGEVRRGRDHEMLRLAGGLADFFVGSSAPFLAFFAPLGLL